MLSNVIQNMKPTPSTSIQFPKLVHEGVLPFQQNLIVWCIIKYKGNLITRSIIIIIIIIITVLLLMARHIVIFFPCFCIFFSSS